MMSRLWPFVMGSIALGLDAYVIAGLLPAIAASLGSTEATVGLGVAAFTGSYAIAGPVLAGRAGRDSRRSLVYALAVFTAANLATLLATSVAVFLVARAIAGASAGVYSPLSSAVSASLVSTEQRGRALALVLSGLAVGTVFGVPIGLAVAQQWGWRTAMVLIVAAGAAALTGILVRGGELPPIPASGARQRVHAVMRPDNLVTVLVTLLTGIASLGLYTYLTLVLNESSLAHQQTLAIWVWGLGGAVGALGVGRLVDKGSPLKLSFGLLAGLTCALVGVTLGHSPLVLLVSLFSWGLCGWASLAPQQHVLLDANPADGATAVAANASANYLGSALGATLGSLLVALMVTPQGLALTAASVAAIAVVLQALRTGLGKRQ